MKFARLLYLLETIFKPASPDEIEARRGHIITDMFGIDVSNLNIKDINVENFDIFKKYPYLIQKVNINDIFTKSIMVGFISLFYKELSDEQLQSIDWESLTPLQWNRLFIHQPDVIKYVPETIWDKYSNMDWKSFYSYIRNPKILAIASNYHNKHEF
jgi:hypothetical protein